MNERPKACWWCGRVAQREWRLNGHPLTLFDIDVSHVFSEIRRRGLVVTLERTS